jgi:hypothetical protein
MYILRRASVNGLSLYYSIAATAFSHKKDRERKCRKRADMTALFPLEEYFSHHSEDFQINLQQQIIYITKFTV